MTWDWAYTFDILPDLAEAVLVTLQATVLGFLLAIVLGLFFAISRRSKKKWIAYPIASVVEFVRSTPLLAQLYFLFYVLPLYGVLMSPLTTGVVGLGLHYSTYLSEVYRAGIESVEKGQWEAATSLNFSRRQVWMRIILPQAIPPVIPVMGNYLIVMFKESPQLSAIAVVELMQTAKIIGARTFSYLEPFTIVGLFFLAMSYPSALLVRRIERSLRNRTRRDPHANAAA